METQESVAAEFTHSFPTAGLLKPETIPLPV